MFSFCYFVECPLPATSKWVNVPFLPPRRIFSFCHFTEGPFCATSPEDLVLSLRLYSSSALFLHLVDISLLLLRLPATSLTDLFLPLHRVIVSFCSSSAPYLSSASYLYSLKGLFLPVRHKFSLLTLLFLSPSLDSSVFSALMVSLIFCCVQLQDLQRAPFFFAKMVQASLLGPITIHLLV